MRMVFGLCLVLSAFAVAGQSLPKLEMINAPRDLTFWAISAVDENVAWVSANHGTIGRTFDGGKHWSFTQIKGREALEFRSIYAFDANTAIIANVGSPAYVLRTMDGGLNWSIVYNSDSPDAFIDGIDFWNKKEGMVYGDPLNGRMFQITTRNAGENWMVKLSLSPVLADGEASFASSGTGIRCVGENMAVIATGGLVSRLFTSNDKGRTWQASDPMLPQGSKTGGIFSVAFANEKHGVLVGGDFADSLAADLARYTTDGGRIWIMPASSPGGTRWCTEFISESVAVAVGPTGGDITLDGGRNWIPLFNEKDFHVVRKSRAGNLVIVAGGKGKLALLK
jgi:photosystem II stability/assembly factor-like uncharacterized protein